MCGGDRADFAGSKSMAQDHSLARPADFAPAAHPEWQPPIGRFPTKFVFGALLVTVLLIRGAAAMHFYMAVPVIALNFIGIVIWAQFYRR